jgi:hypothetical protein
MALSESEKQILRYLGWSHGTCGFPTDHTISCFVGMIKTGESTIEDFKRIASVEIVERIEKELAKWNM